MNPSFLIVRFSAIGDCVMAAYVASAIRSKHPHAELTWAVESRCLAMLDSDRLINHVVDFPRDRWRKSRWSPTVWREQLSKFAALRQRTYDFGLDLQGHSKTAVCLRIAKPNQRISAFTTDSLAKRLNPLLPGDPDDRHRVERMMNAAQAFGDFQVPANPIMPTPLSRMELGLPEGKPLATISTGAGAAVKQYPARQWESVINGLIANGFNVLSLGAASDPKLQVQGLVDQVGKWNLNQTMSAVAHSDIHLAADTGTGHMAAAFGVPFVSVFGPTDPKLFRPYSDNGVVLRNSDNPADVTPSEILTAVDKLLA